MGKVNRLFLMLVTKKNIWGVYSTQFKAGHLGLIGRKLVDVATVESKLENKKNGLSNLTQKFVFYKKHRQSHNGDIALMSCLRSP